MTKATILDSVETCVDNIIETIGLDVRIGVPLGLGKPTELVNALYQRACKQPEFKLTILTALSLEVPDPGEGLQKRLMAPFFDRIFGSYPGLDYMSDLRAGTVPNNITIHEFFFKSGAMMNNPQAQQNFISTNYTHSVRDLINQGINVLGGLIAFRHHDGEDQYSLSCNPETALDLIPRVEAQRRAGKPMLIVGEVNENLPFMVNDAQIDVDVFDLLVKNSIYNTTLFAPPNPPVTPADYMIGLNASTLIADGGTLQIGIGSLGDAIVYGCELRHQNNDAYKSVLADLQHEEKYGDLIQNFGGTTPFKEGLYGNSEMFVGGFYHLIKEDILRRKVWDDINLQRLIVEKRLSETLVPEHLTLLLEEGVINSPLTEQDLTYLKHYGIFKEDTRIDQDYLISETDVSIPNDLLAHGSVIAKHCMGDCLKQGRIMHGGFFLGSNEFYDGLRNLDEETRSSINMTNISYVNQLYGNEELKRLQRQKARFINTVFMVHALGAATSDGLENGQVVSGVGGQYNFVAQAHELEDARSILLLKSTREKDGVTQSNIVWSYGNTTIPRHLRDIYVTEYGIADVRGECDKDIIAALLNVADSRFQPELMEKAKKAGKLPMEYQIPEQFQNNTPERLANTLKTYQQRGLFPTFPCGTEFTDMELALAQCLKSMKAKISSKSTLINAQVKALTNPTAPDHLIPFLDRLMLTDPKSMEDKIARVLLIDELEMLLG